MYFGNSRVTLNQSINCNHFGITDKTFAIFVYHFEPPKYAFLGYGNEDQCYNFDKFKDWIDITTFCLDYVYCKGVTGNPLSVYDDQQCAELASGFPDMNVLLNTYNGGQTGFFEHRGAFCTHSYGWSDYNCGLCPEGFSSRRMNGVWGCFAIVPIEAIGLDFTDEINPCKFFHLLSNAEASSFSSSNSGVDIYYKSIVNGVERCNVASYTSGQDPCVEGSVNCWPPPSGRVVPNPSDGTYVDVCDLCDEQNIAGDICEFESVIISSNSCKCPYTLTCFGELVDQSTVTEGNCFFAPGITTTEPCVNGSWNGASCADGYNDVCASTNCVDKICKELDWFIQNYASYTGDTNWFGYASIVTDQENIGNVTGTAEEFFVSCGPTGVSAFDDFGYLNVTFGETASLRQWSRIVGFLNYWTKKSASYTGIIFDANGGDPDHQKSLPLSESLGTASCGWFYPTNLCCPSIPQGLNDYDCPICGPSGFTEHSPAETSCCCSKLMPVIVLGLNEVSGYTGFNIAYGADSIGIQPITSLKG